MRIAFSLALMVTAILYQQRSAAMQRGAFTQYGNYKVSCGALTSSSGLQKEAYKDGRLTAFVRGRHTHGLALDAADNLYGEDAQFVEGRLQITLWRAHPGGSVENLVSIYTDRSRGMNGV